MAEEITLRLDRATAEDLYVTLYEVGEHIAAGAPVTAPTKEEAERLGALLHELAHAIGRRCNAYCDHLG
ncbi:hypothetical protein [Paractinoplanes brasiliensis]|uniref:Uncharacterized protein n=1 Tax=Paractinoplanes brasiliensis TaxID=52695 RepID=A0A4R6K138_9ACTN|nr:hypothetical protein [Actinoplanes brasiliensis]TDO41791.1 hypothetical protein C8E87_5534 [Actinoplanes brasiliensis]GID29940.1 hypothetical protein Abr02nite_49230 [Actinoplanes brasiliensis]